MKTRLLYFIIENFSFIKIFIILLLSTVCIKHKTRYKKKLKIPDYLRHTYQDRAPFSLNKTNSAYLQKRMSSNFYYAPILSPDYWH